MGNIPNRTIFTGDNLAVLRGFNTDSVDLIYLDPPFNSKRDWNAPIGSAAAGAAFKDTWTLSDIDLQWHEQLRSQNRALHDVILAAQGAGGNSTMSYLLMMAPRLLELHRVLKDTGSIYLHCDPTESHALKLVLDTIFGRDCFQKEIVWKMPRPSGFKTQANNWIRGHDIILYYAGPGRTFNKQYEPYEASYLKNFNRVDSEGRNYWMRGGKRRYPGKGYTLSDTWVDIHSMQTQSVSGKEGVGYPTQKPLALLRRIIQASSNPGDVVLDPFCGCATACIAAEELDRQWIGIDLSAKAAELVELRLHEQLGLTASLANHRTDQPLRTDLGDLPPPRYWKPELYGTQEGHCAGCGHHFEFRHLEVDHVVPRKVGGTDHKGNLQLLCGNCNRRKGAGSMAKLMVKLLDGRR